MIYLDHHAASPLSSHARDAIVQALDAMHSWANPSSVHRAGQAAKRIIENARDALGQALCAHPADIVLTSGGTEACNLGIFGLLGGALDRNEAIHVVASAIEHPAVDEPLQYLEKAGRISLTRLASDPGQPPTLKALEAALRPETKMVAIQWVNHETGTILPVQACADYCYDKGILCFVDASQALGKVEINVNQLRANAVALAATKIGGAAGAGALWAKRGTALRSLIVGGGQERGRRAGSPDVFSVAAMGGAARAIGDRLNALPAIRAKVCALETMLIELGGVINGQEGERIGTVVNASFNGLRGEDMVTALDVEGICASAGAACSSGRNTPSPVLRALYRDQPWRAESALRLSLGPATTQSDIEQASKIIPQVFMRLRKNKL